MLIRMFWGVSSFAKNIFRKCYEFLQFGSIMLIIWLFLVLWMVGMLCCVSHIFFFSLWNVICIQICQRWCKKMIEEYNTQNSVEKSNTEIAFKKNWQVKGEGNLGLHTHFILSYWLKAYLQIYSIILCCHSGLFEIKPIFKMNAELLQNFYYSYRLVTQIPTV